MDIGEVKLALLNAIKDTTQMRYTADNGTQYVPSHAAETVERLVNAFVKLHSNA